MRFRQRNRDEEERPGGEPAAEGTPGFSELDGLMRAAEGFLAAGDEAINEALSEDSQKFMAASRQKGGE